MRNAMRAAKKAGRLREQSVEEILGVSAEKFFSILNGLSIPKKWIRTEKVLGRIRKGFYKRGLAKL